jgi:uncharacterized protein (TIGR03086 family)
MASPAISDLDALTLTTPLLIETCRRVQAEHLTLPTPCPDWTLQELLDHVVGGNLFTIEILTGATADQGLATTMVSFEDGSATTDDIVSSTLAMRDLFNQPGALRRSYHHVAGDLIGVQVLRLRLQDLIVHCWDIGKTLNEPTPLPSELVKWGLNELDDRYSLTSEHFASHPLVEGTRLPEAKYLAAFGRSSNP